MQVRLLTSIAGHAEPKYDLDDFAYSPGDTPDLNADLAKAWVAAGIAEPVKATKASKATNPVVSDPAEV